MRYLYAVLIIALLVSSVMPVTGITLLKERLLRVKTAFAIT